MGWGPSLNVRYDFDHTGLRLDTDYTPYFAIQGRGQTFIYLRPYEELRERLRPQDFCFLRFLLVLFSPDAGQSGLSRAHQRRHRPDRILQEERRWARAITGATA